MGTTRRIAPLVCGVLLVGVTTLNSAAALKMEVSPTMSRAPAVLRVRVMVAPASDDRALHVVAESANYYRSSAVELDGSDSDALQVFEFRDLPAGMYQITGTIVDGHGPRATATRLARVEPTFGGR